MNKKSKKMPFGAYCDVKTRVTVYPGPSPEMEEKMARENRAYGRKAWKKIKLHG